MKKKRILVIVIILITAAAGAFFIYTGTYYHADRSAVTELRSDDTVSVTQTDYGWLFDGPSESDALIFYPGGKVEETAYAPLLHRLAGQGLDVCLVRMPFRLAVFDADAADRIIENDDYEHWYIGGHSLGGAMAANYAADHEDALSGVILLAAYPTKAIDSSITLITVYGSEDGVLNITKVSEGKQFSPENSSVFVIDGGNHAQFGNYGKQRGDGDAFISAGEQQRKAVDLIIQNIKRAE